MKGSGRENILNLKEGELEKGTWRSGGEGEEEKGLTAGDRVLSRHLAGANRDEEEKKNAEKRQRQEPGVEVRKEDQQITVIKEMIVAAVEEDIDSGEMMTQEMVVAATAGELEDRWRRQNEAGEQAAA